MDNDKKDDAILIKIKRIDEQLSKLIKNIHDDIYNKEPPFEVNTLKSLLTMLAIVRNTMHNLNLLFSVLENYSEKGYFGYQNISEQIHFIGTGIDSIMEEYTKHKELFTNNLPSIIDSISNAQISCSKYVNDRSAEAFFYYEKQMKIAIDQKNEISTSLKNLSVKTQDLEKKLFSLDADTFKSGLAISFKNRFDGMKGTILCWLYGAIISILSIPISLAVIEFFLPFNQDAIFISISIRTPIIFALFWIAWIASKKYSYLSAIRDDYRYKYDLAMAYQGYSAEVKKLPNSDNLLTLLLGGLIQNISQSPLDKVKSEPHTPWAETITPIIEKIGNNKDK